MTYLQYDANGRVLASQQSMRRRCLALSETSELMRRITARLVFFRERGHHLKSLPQAAGLGAAGGALVLGRFLVEQFVGGDLHRLDPGQSRRKRAGSRRRFIVGNGALRRSGGFGELGLRQPARLANGGQREVRFGTKGGAELLQGLSQGLSFKMAIFGEHG